MFVRTDGAFTRVYKLKCAQFGYTPGFSYKHWTWLERLTRDKNSTLFKKFVNYGRKKFF